MKTLAMETNRIITSEMVWEEERVFLFIDLNNSTYLAEKLGNKLFSYLITQCVAEIYPLVHQYKAQLYQIVGDEIVLTWLKSECSDVARVAQLFFDFEKKISNSAVNYRQCYGLLPTFKAACHLGKVAVSANIFAADEPVYRGDVLNTCGGLFKLCKALDKRMAVTEAFVNEMKTPAPFRVLPLGRYLIKGKQNYENIYTVSEDQ
jgi:adenylate cyclase